MLARIHLLLALVACAHAVCQGAADCSLGGICVGGVCVCDAAFTGPTCSRLNLLPAPTTALWNAGNATASWGGNVVFDESDGKWHLFFAELLDHCPLRFWGTNSVVSHATGDSPTGPYTKKETVQPAFHHNPTVAYDPNSKTFLLVSIGNGSSSGTVPAHCNASSHDVESRLSHPVDAGVITLSYSSSANGPWTTLARPLLRPRPGKWDFFVTNPSVHIMGNGTILMAYRAGNASHGPNGGRTGIAVAPSWEAPFERVSDKPVYPDVNEDPGLFVDARGNFHIVSHYWKHGPGGHAFSADGRSWSFAGQAYGFEMNYTDGSSVTLKRRERPQVVSIGGEPAFLFTGAMPEHGLSRTQVQPINRLGLGGT